MTTRGRPGQGRKVVSFDDYIVKQCSIKEEKDAANAQLERFKSRISKVLMSTGSPMPGAPKPSSPYSLPDINWETTSPSPLARIALPGSSASLVSSPVRCGWCEDATAELFCSECAQVFCTENGCDEDAHMKSPQHMRVPLEQSSTFASSLPKSPTPSSEHDQHLAALQRQLDEHKRHLEFEKEQETALMERKVRQRMVKAQHTNMRLCSKTSCDTMSHRSFCYIHGVLRAENLEMDDGIVDVEVSYGNVLGSSEALVLEEVGSSEDESEAWEAPEYELISTLSLLVPTTSGWSNAATDPVAPVSPIFTHFQVLPRTPHQHLVSSDGERKQSLDFTHIQIGSMSSPSTTPEDTKRVVGDGCLTRDACEDEDTDNSGENVPLIFANNLSELDSDDAPADCTSDIATVENGDGDVQPSDDEEEEDEEDEGEFILTEIVESSADEGSDNVDADGEDKHASVDDLPDDDDNYDLEDQKGEVVANHTTDFAGLITDVITRSPSSTIAAVPPASTTTTTMPTISPISTSTVAVSTLSSTDLTSSPPSRAISSSKAIRSFPSYMAATKSSQGHSSPLSTARRLAQSPRKFLKGSSPSKSPPRDNSSPSKSPAKKSPSKSPKKALWNEEAFYGTLDDVETSRIPQKTMPNDDRILELMERLSQLSSLLGNAEPKMRRSEETERQMARLNLWRLQKEVEDIRLNGFFDSGRRRVVGVLDKIRVRVDRWPAAFGGEVLLLLDSTSSLLRGDMETAPKKKTLASTAPVSASPSTASEDSETPSQSRGSKLGVVSSVRASSRRREQDKALRHEANAQLPVNAPLSLAITKRRSPPSARNSTYLNVLNTTLPTSKMAATERAQSASGPATMANFIRGRRRRVRQCAIDGCANFGASMCAQCTAVFYCGKECQLAHWKEHSLVCVPVGVTGPSQPATISTVHSCRSEVLL